MADDATATAPASLAGPMAAWGERTAELSTLWVTPVRAVLEEQQELIDAVRSERQDFTG